jgi:BED zinc finger
LKCLFYCLSEPRHRHEPELSSPEAGTAAATTRTHKTALKRNRVIWDFFSEEENSTEDYPRGKCNVCGHHIKRSGASPSSMKSHLRVKHPNEYEQYVRRMKEFKKEQVNLVVITRSQEH